MPTIEFYGFSKSNTLKNISKFKKQSSKLDYYKDIVFVVYQLGTTVIDTNGKSKPFVRILTRSIERAAQLKELLVPTMDVEVVHIDFYPRKARGIGKITG